MRLTKDFKFRLKATENGSGAFTGMAAVYGNVDLGGDIIETGAFKQTLSQNASYPLLWQHLPGSPIGLAKLSDTRAGLVIDGQLLLDVPEAQTAYSLLKAGVVKGLSIGYDAVRDSFDAAGVRHLQELRLWEVSIVTFPMNENAKISSVKGLADAQKVLRDASIEARHDPRLLKELRAFHRELRKTLADESDVEDVCECACEECQAGDCMDCSDPECDDPNCLANKAAEEEKKEAVILLKAFAASLKELR
jgi:HK97 family phage prohead protease